MGLSGVSGPFKGAYCAISFSTVGAGVGLGSTVQHNFWSYTAPMDMELVDLQFWSTAATGSTRVNLLAGGASVLQTGVNSETANGVGLTAGELLVAGASSVNATLSKGIFGATATSIIAPVTPSAPGNIINRQYAYGAYVVAGATLSATVSNDPGAANAGVIQGTLLWFPRTHPAALRSSFE